jgi:hypothetical protein
MGQYNGQTVRSLGSDAVTVDKVTALTGQSFLCLVQSGDIQGILYADSLSAVLDLLLLWSLLMLHMPQLCEYNLIFCTL